MATFNDILGYEKPLKEIKTICDYLKNTKKYKDFGVKIPEGILICGERGVGKTLFANALADESNRNTYRPSEKSEHAIKKAIKLAVKNTPSVLIFDDLDCYPECVYPLIDEFLTKLDNDIFVISTAMDKEGLPESLLACNAFEMRITLKVPEFEDSKLIFKKYFSDKKVADDFNLEDFCYIAEDWSVSMVEDVYNEASIYAVHEGATQVTLDHIFRAALKIDDKYLADKFRPSTAYHEAGHAVVDLLQGGEAAYIFITDVGSGQYVKKTQAVESYKDRQNSYTVAFAGIACEELYICESAIGGYTDLGNVSKNIEEDNKFLACQGFEYYDSIELNSPAFNDALAKKVQSDMQSYYDKAKKIIEDNKPLVEALVEALKKKNYLLHSEIHSIYDEYLRDKK